MLVVSDTQPQPLQQVLHTQIQKHQFLIWTPHWKRRCYGLRFYMNGSLKGTVTQTSASITGLTENTSYRFTLRQDAAGNTSYSSTLLALLP